MIMEICENDDTIIAVWNPISLLRSLKSLENYPINNTLISYSDFRFL